MARYTVGKPQFKRINAGEPFAEEWFDIKVSLTMADVLAIQGAASDMERGLHLLSLLIVDWSLLDESGGKAPLNQATINMVPLEMLGPLFEEVNKPDFLVRLNTLASPAQSQP